MEYSVILSERLICDLELLLDGSFSPLKGFMNEKDYKGVVKNMRLSNGDLWSMPIVLPIDPNLKEKIQHEDYVILKNSYNLPLAKLYIEDIYKPDIDFECEKVYGTTDTNHPYVKILKDFGEVYYIGGKVKKINDIPHFDFKDTIKEGSFQVKCFVEPRSYHGQVHGVINALDLNNQKIDQFSMQIENGFQKGRWLVHDKWSFSKGRDLNNSYSGSCFILSSKKLEILNEKLKELGIKPCDIINGTLEEM